MPGQFTAEFSMRTGAVRYRDLAYLLAGKDDLTADDKQHTAIITWDNGQFGAEVINWTALSATIVRHPIEQMLAIGEMGDVYCLGSGDDHEEIIIDGPIKPEKRGTLRKVRAIDGMAYAAGMDRQVYRRDDIKRWTCIDESMRPPKDSDEVVGFESIDGFSAEDIYAVGWDGAIWQFNGRLWKPIDSPTNVILTDVCCAPDGNVYACGRTGVLLRGSAKRWGVIEHEATEEDFWSLAWFNDRLYLSTTQFVYRLEDDSLEPVDFGDEFPDTCYHLSAADGLLWSIGAKDVLSFDGDEWTRIE